MSDPAFLTIEQVKTLHRTALDQYGGQDGVRDAATLESAVMNPCNVRPGTPSDLKLRLIQYFLREVGSDLLADSSTMDFAQLCRQMRIADGPAEAMHPLNVGLMFFNPAPQKFFPQTQIDVVQFPDGLGGDTFTEKTFAGPLDVILKDVLTFLKNAVIEERVVKHGDRPEREWKKTIFVRR